MSLCLSDSFKKGLQVLPVELDRTFLMVVHLTRTGLLSGGFLRGALLGSADAVMR